jgi:enoyl-[acyl-carrier protein] reductase II
MRTNNRITKLFNIKYPIIQGGMVWVSGWKLASAVSENGGLGLIGSGSMKPELLAEHIRQCKSATTKPFGVNLPLIREDVEDLIKVILEEGVKIVFTSAGHPGKHIEKFKSKGVKVAHVVSSVKQGLKAESVGCDAIVGEGFEAGGHNGFDELTTFALIPQLVSAVNIPVIAAGGIVDGRGMLAAFALGAEGVQLGTRFASTVESSAHENFKRKIVEAKDNDTVLILRKAMPARVIKNNFAFQALNAEAEGKSKEELLELLKTKRERIGIFEGNENEGMLEAGQSAGLITKILPVKEVFTNLLSEFEQAKQNLCI